MCTVSFVKSNDTFIITSNRDEKIVRPAIEPKSYVVNSKKLIFPQDPKAGGTWYAVDENGTVLVLLNGAEEKHVVKTPYRRSRGLIVLDIISQASPIIAWDELELDNVEPFTLVLFQDQKLFQLRWNGDLKSTKNLAVSENHIWSSSTLYPQEVRAIRSEWFKNYLDVNPNLSAAQMLHFHRYTEENNTENGLVIDRNDTTKTLSITQTVIEKNKFTLQYFDLMYDKDYVTNFIIA